MTVAGDADDALARQQDGAVDVWSAREVKPASGLPRVIKQAGFVTSSDSRNGRKFDTLAGAGYPNATAATCSS